MDHVREERNVATIVGPEEHREEGGRSVRVLDAFLAKHAIAFDSSQDAIQLEPVEWRLDVDGLELALTQEDATDDASGGSNPGRPIRVDVLSGLPEHQKDGIAVGAPVPPIGTPSPRRYGHT